MRSFRLLLALICLVIVAAPPCLAHQAPVTGRDARKLTGVVMRPVPLRGEGFSLALPQGWRVQQAPLENEEPEIKASAPDGRVGAYIYPLFSLTNLYVETSGIIPWYRECMASQGVLPCANNLLERLASFDFQRHDAAQALNLLLASLRQKGDVVQILRLHRLSPTKLEGRAILTAQGKSLEEWFLLQTVYVPNPLFRRPGAVESFAFLRGCKAPSGDLGRAALEQCTTVLGSFHPRPTWANGPVTNVLRFYALMGRQIQDRLEANSVYQFGLNSISEYRRTEGIIANWGNQMRQMQMQQFAQSMANNYHVTNGWMNALSGRVDLYDPQNGEVYNVDTDFESYAHYCKAPGGSIFAWNGATSACGTGQVSLQPTW